LNASDIDIILLDMNFRSGEDDGREGMYWLERIVEACPECIVVLMTAYGEVELAVKAMKVGAFDFILKPFKNEKVLATLHAGFRLKNSQKEVVKLKSLNKTIEQNEMIEHAFLGHSLPMRKVFQTIEKVAQTDANVLILGENGTGKELAARAIHRASQRSRQPFVDVDLGALNENLFESELFGHKKGAFTDAVEDRIGRFELAHEGTLFLDEIGNLAPPLQAKLLSALQNREVSKLGSSQKVSVNIRLISATNMPLYEMAARDEFRQDLLYRINTVEIRMPALRERIEDLPLLVEHFLRRFAKRYNKPVPEFGQGAWEKLKKYNWPGNIRELQHTLERALILSDGPSLEAIDFQLSPMQMNTDELGTLNLHQMEEHLIQKALEKHNGNISKAAKDLGLTRAALYRRLDKYDI
jgi:DNA-binding NtrC family response regulator